MEITGTVKSIGEEKQVTASFVKRELVVTTDETYPQHILIEFVQDRVDLLDKVSQGDKVSVGINLRGREWQSPSGETKFFNSIHGWKIQKVGAAQQEPVHNYVPPLDSEDDSLPF